MDILAKKKLDARFGKSGENDPVGRIADDPVKRKQEAMRWSFLQNHE